MRLVQITSPEGAISLLNVDHIKSIVPFGDGGGCTIQMLGDPEWKHYKSIIKYDSFIEHLKVFDVGICYPINEVAADIAPKEEVIASSTGVLREVDHNIVSELMGELEAERSRTLGFRNVLCSVLTSIGRRSLDAKRFIYIITKAIEDVPASGPISARRAVLQTGEQMVLRSTRR